MRPSHFILWLLILTVGFFTVSCGKKTRPVPPQSVLPARITDLSYQTDDNGITLTWNWPDRTEQGGNLKSLSHFLVEKAEYRAEEFCKECPIRYDKTAKIDGGSLPSSIESRQIKYHDSELKPDHQYYYRISSSVGWNVVSLPSAPVNFIWQTPLSSPAGLAASPGDGEIHIGWNPVSTDIDDQPTTDTIRYRVYRGTGQEKPALIEDSLSSPEYLDRRVINDTIYRYQVMAFRTTGSGGRLSKIIEVKPSDLTPPPAPRELKALRTLDGVKLFWDPVKSEDLAGYKVFRRDTYQAPKPGQEKGKEQNLDYIEVGLVNSPATSFTDRNPPGKSGTWHYAVSSFDKAEPPNISPLSWEVKIKREK